MEKFLEAFRHLKNVGWVQRSETHLYQHLVGSASLHPPYYLKLEK